MINNIQVLRAFAALVVVAYHVVTFANVYGYATTGWNWLNPWGAAGVDVFFVISGFIMTYTLHVSPKTPAAFLVGRVVRIVPLYWAMTLAMIVLFLLVPGQFRENGFDLWHALSALTFTSGLAGFDYPVIQPGWTLEYEMGFYLLLATAIALIPSRSTLAAVLALFACVAIGMHWVVLEFALGMLVARLFIKGVFAKYGAALLTIGVFALGFSATRDLQTQTGFGMPIDRLFVWGLPSALIVLGACHVRQISNRTVLFVGAASYSIYLLQSFSMPIYFKAISYLDLPGNLGPLLVPLCIAFTAVAGCILYRLFERPVGIWLSKRLKRSRRQSSAMPLEPAR